MSETKTRSVATFDARPLQPHSTAATSWVVGDKKGRAFRLGNKASLEEITGETHGPAQRWRWRVCQFGGGQGIENTLEKAARAAEFSLGLGEMPIVLPEKPKKKGGVA